MIKFIIDEEGLMNDPKVPDWIKENPQILIPERKTQHSAGYDIKLPYDLTIRNSNNVLGVALAETYIKIEMDPKYVAYMFIRSSVGVKKYTVLANGTGVIDADYKDTIKLPLKLYAPIDEKYSAGEPVAQIVFHQYFITDEDKDKIKNNVDDKPVRTGGIGSTNKK